MKIAIATIVFVLTLTFAGEASSAPPAGQHDLLVIKPYWFQIPPVVYYDDPLARESRKRHCGYKVESLGYREQCEHASESERSEAAEGLEQSGVIFEGAFVYKVRIKNTGVKAVNTVVWDYVFSDPVSGSELTRHTFNTAANIAAGQTNTLTEYSVRPPTHVITTAMLSRPEEYRERVEIKMIEYADGTTWIDPEWKKTKSK